MSTQESKPPSVPSELPQDRKVPWYFEKTGPALFNEWSVTHLAWGALFQLLFPERYVAGLVMHTIYESIEGYIFPAEFRDVSVLNHVGDTISFAAGMLVIPPMRERSPTDMVRILAEARSQAKR